MDDPKSVVSFSRVFPLKAPQGEYTHVFTADVASIDGTHNRVWLRYTSEDNAEKGRKALFAAIHRANEVGTEKKEESAVPSQSQE